MYIFSSVLLIVFAVFGVVSLVRELSLRIFTNKNDCSVIIITPLENKDEAEFALRSTLSRLRWSSKNENIRVCVNSVLDEKTKRICETVCKEYGFKGLISADEAGKLLEK